ncbi:MAG: hypothetical protein ABH828_02185 [archaeon]
MKKLITIALMAALCLNPIKADSWLKFRGSRSNNTTLLTAEAGSNITNRLETYGFADAEEKNICAESRLTYNVGKTKLISEYNGGTGYKDAIRLGFAFKPNLGKNNFTFVKLFPFESTGKKGPQVSMFTSQDMGKIDASLLVDYNISPGTVYVEPTLDLKLGKNYNAFIQGRSFGKIKEIDFSIYMGLSKSF